MSKMFEFQGWGLKFKFLEKGTFLLTGGGSKFLAGGGSKNLKKLFQNES